MRNLPGHQRIFPTCTKDEMLEELGTLAPEEQCLKSKACDVYFRKFYEPLLLEIEAEMISSEHTTWKDLYSSGPLLLTALGLDDDTSKVKMSHINLQRQDAVVVDDYKDAQLIKYSTPFYVRQTHNQNGNSEVIYMDRFLSVELAKAVMLGCGCAAIVFGCNMLINRAGGIAHLRARRFGLPYLRNLGFQQLVYFGNKTKNLREKLNTLSESLPWPGKPKHPLQRFVVEEDYEQENLIKDLLLQAQEEDERELRFDEDGFPVGNLEEMLNDDNTSESTDDSLSSESGTNISQSETSGEDKAQPDRNQFLWDDGTESFNCWLMAYQIKVLDKYHNEEVLTVVTIRELVNLLRTTASFRKRTHNLLLVLKSKAVAWMKHLRIAEHCKNTIIMYALSLAMVPDKDEILSLKNMIYEDKQRLANRLVLESVNHQYRPSLFEWFDVQIGIRFRDWFYKTFTTWVAPTNRELRSE